MDEVKLQQIAELLEGVPYYQWCKVRHAIEQKYSSMMGKVTVANTEELLKSLKFEVLGEWK